MSTTLTNRWDSLFSNAMDAVTREFDRDFRSTGNGIRNEFRRYGGLAVWEDDGHIHIEMDLPGLHLDDLSLSMEKGQLWIRGERKLPQHDRKTWYDERYYGAFQRVVVLNDSVDPESIDATLEDGVLYISIAKKAEHQPRRIEVKAGKGSQKRLEQN
ncbi:Spore protein SP21 [Maioricimonas rarisocia]|uniref:Spore protein SP21 n=1 Tax=Maioricimonas rarisocia TaxID=2528026 RepID=A0A517Z6W6_9PLAN|nr:Hsp20/alpha crystallin family protein [Maioricimonas rarisocia]QDU38232.1 Spore protein SP21 [Maioricimonas rarisocia]